MREENKVLDHSYDGIQEYDNPIPLWLTFIFVTSVLFAIGYGVYYHVLGGPSLLDEYNTEMATARATRTAVAKAAPAVDLNAMANNPAAQQAGAAIFAQNCAACHGTDAKSGLGKIGPNLTDSQWIHGGTMEQIVHTITDGVLVKGMPAWGPVLGPQRVRQAAAYIHSLGGGQ